jgi:stage V sporulation protein SpoVS
MEGGQTDLRDVAQLANPTLKVGSESRPQSVARAIGHVARESPSGAMPSILATGPQAINQAVKAIAIARRQALEESNDITAVCNFEKGLREGSNVSIALSKCAPLGEPAEGTDELSAKQGTDCFKLAGAIAGRIREGGARQLLLFAKGPVPVLIAVKAIGAAQEYVAEQSLRLKFAVSLVDKENTDLRGKDADGNRPTSTYAQFTIMAVPA